MNTELIINPPHWMTPDVQTEVEWDCVELYNAVTMDRQFYEDMKPIVEQLTRILNKVAVHSYWPERYKHQHLIKEYESQFIHGHNIFLAWSSKEKTLAAINDKIRAYVVRDKWEGHHYLDVAAKLVLRDIIQKVCFGELNIPLIDYQVNKCLHRLKWTKKRICEEFGLTSHHLNKKLVDELNFNYWRYRRMYIYKKIGRRGLR